MTLFVVLTTIMSQVPVMQHSQCNTSLFLWLPVETGLLMGEQRPNTLRSKRLYMYQRCTDLIDGEHVEICNVVFMGVFDPRPALLLVYQLTDVFVHKLALLKTEINIRPGSEQYLEPSELVSSSSSPS